MQRAVTRRKKFSRAFSEFLNMKGYAAPDSDSGTVEVGVVPVGLVGGLRWLARRQFMEQLPNGFVLGERVSAVGIGMSGEGFMILDGRVRRNEDRGNYRNDRHVVLVWGEVQGMPRGAREREKFYEERGVYFDVNDVRRLRPCMGDEIRSDETMVTGARMEGIADRLEEISIRMKKIGETIEDAAGVIDSIGFSLDHDEHVEHTGSRRMGDRGKRLKRAATQLRALVGGNGGGQQRC